MLISVVICTYNGEKYLEEQLRSVMNQSYKNLEIIINDDCSTDNTLELVKTIQKKDDRIKVYQNEKNLGFNKNFEKSLGYVSGELVALCDQDDIWKVEKLQKQYDLLLETNSSLVYSNSQLIDSDGNDLKKNLFTQLHVHPVSGDTQLGFLFDNCIAGHTILFKKVLIQQIYPLPRTIFFDRWIGFVASYNASINLIKEPLVYYRQHSSNVTDILRKKKKKKTLKMRIEKREKAFAIKVEQFEDFLTFFDRNNISNESSQIIQSIYNELKNYEQYFLTLNYL